MAVGCATAGFDDVAAGDCVAATVGDETAATVRVAFGVFATRVGLRVCVAGADGGGVVVAVLVDMLGRGVNVLVDAARVDSAVVVRNAGVAALARAVGVGVSGPLSPGRSSTGCATTRLFVQ